VPRREVLSNFVEHLSDAKTRPEREMEFEPEKSSEKVACQPRTEPLPARNESTRCRLTREATPKPPRPCNSSTSCRSGGTGRRNPPAPPAARLFPNPKFKTKELACSTVQTLPSGRFHRVGKDCRLFPAVEIGLGPRLFGSERGKARLSGRPPQVTGRLRR
jgi:hypothetical protein